MCADWKLPQGKATLLLQVPIRTARRAPPPRAEHPPCCEWLTVATALLVQKFDKDGDGEMGLQDMRVLMQRLEKL